MGRVADGQSMLTAALMQRGTDCVFCATVLGKLWPCKTILMLTQNVNWTRFPFLYNPFGPCVRLCMPGQIIPFFHYLELRVKPAVR